jgi:DNA-binding transcriptional ArsR family regulator
MIKGKAYKLPARLGEGLKTIAEITDDNLKIYGGEDGVTSMLKMGNLNSYTEHLYNALLTSVKIVTGTTMDDMLIRNRKHSIIKIRSAAIYILYKHTLLSKIEISRRFKLDHSTISHHLDIMSDKDLHIYNRKASQMLMIIEQEFLKNAVNGGYTLETLSKEIDNKINKLQIIKRYVNSGEYTLLEVVDKFSEFMNE